MTKTKIEWCDYTWNPIVGCAGGCSYCYAKKLNNRYKWLPDFTKPKFYPERISEPYKLKKPSIVFVCSMGDIFGLTRAEVNTIIISMAVCPQHVFMVLTKRPEEYHKYEWPENVMLGITITNQNMMDNLAEIVFDTEVFDRNKMFLSLEPLLDPIKLYVDPDLVIVGAQTNPSVRPERKWIDGIIHRNIFYKDSIVKYFPDLPRGDKNQIWRLFQ